MISLRASTLILDNMPGGLSIRVPASSVFLTDSYKSYQICPTYTFRLAGLHCEPSCCLVACGQFFRPVTHTKQVFASGVVAVDFSLDSTVTCSHAGVPLLLVAIKPIVRVSSVLSSRRYSSPWSGSPFLPSRRLRSSLRSPYRPYYSLSCPFCRDAHECRMGQMSPSPFSPSYTFFRCEQLVLYLLP